MSANPFDHVSDAHHFEIWPSTGLHIHLPNILGFQITKFMVLEVVAAVLMLAIFVPFARRVASGKPPRGAWDNFLESILTFIRDNVARPYIGHADHHTGENHEADKFVPYLWTVFIFIFLCNVFGLIPFLGSPTADFGVTLALALCSLVLIHGAPIAAHGPVKYLKSYFPHADFEGRAVAVLGMLILLGVALIEIMGTFIKGFVLALRLFANMFAGHTVMAFILMFIYQVRDSSTLFAPVTLATVFGLVALSFLELFVAMLQAFVFTFLTALFLGSALHPEH